jgi:protein arginine N-methyltransferase 5
MPIAHPRHKRDFSGNSQARRLTAFTRADLILNSSGKHKKTVILVDHLKNVFFSFQDWSTLIVGKISPHIDLDHEDNLLRQESEKVLDQELSFAGHLGLPAVLVPLRKNNTNFARVLHNKVLSSPLNQVYLYLGYIIREDFYQSYVSRLGTMSGFTCP